MLSTGTNLRTDWPDGHRLKNRQQFNVVEILDDRVKSRQFNDIIRRSAMSMMKNHDVEHLITDSLIDAMSSGSKANESQLSEIAAFNEVIGDDTLSTSIRNAISRSAELMSGYKGIDETDASVFVSPRMYRDIKEMLGEWDPSWMDEAFNLLEADDQSWMSDPEKYEKVSKLALQPLKMIYVGDRIEKQTKIDVPIIDKMALFPVFKFMAHGELGKLYSAMNKVNEDGSRNEASIDMAAYKTAVKVGNSNAKKYQDTNFDVASTKKQEFKYLRKQLVTDAHISDKTKLARCSRLCIAWKYRLISASPAYLLPTCKAISARSPLSQLSDQSTAPASSKKTFGHACDCSST
jgi:hypothetical protein